MSDWLKLRNIEVMCMVGVPEWERKQPQQLLLDLELPTDTKQAAVGDDVTRAIDYAAVMDTVRTNLSTKTYHLIESIAEDIAACVLHDFHVPHVIVRVKKHTVPGVAEAIVEISRP